MITNLTYLLLIGALVGASSGYLGSFMVLKRMSLVGDALSHVALPGIAIALTFGINPMFGAFVALTIAIIGVWYLSEKSDSFVESLVGIFFTASLAVGILITPEPEVFEALFGDIDKVTKLDGIYIILGSILIFVLTKLISKKLMIGIVSEDLAKAQKINVSQVNLIYLLLVGLVVAFGVKFLGTLLTGALVIIPAVTAKNLAKSTRSYHIISITIGLLTSVVGILIAKTYGISTGPIVILTGIVMYIFSTIFSFQR
ncbi:MAG: ABC-3 protein [uncultured bacterium]|nr:MAG: ABC-3 protein [uncultured bacterium]